MGRNVYSNEWHENCYDNWTKSLEAARQQRDSLAATIERSESDLREYWIQIRTAKEKGKSGFDRDKFLKARKTA